MEIAYQIITSTRIWIQYVLWDFFHDLSWEILDCRTTKGRILYRALFGRQYRTKSTRRQPPTKLSLELLERLFEQKQIIDFLLTHFNEQNRRLFAGFLVSLLGSKSVQPIAQLTGLDVKTLDRGLKELLKQHALPLERLRHPGGGRPTKEEEVKGYKEALDCFLGDDLAGDPMTSKKWVRRSLRHIKEFLQKKQIRAAPNTIRKSLKSMQISLKKNKKVKSAQSHPERDTQFQYLNKLKNEWLKAGKPIISIDTKKKEHIGNFSNPGRTWCKEPYETLDHDFPSLGDGKLVPFGVYDLQQNKGVIYCGTSNETSQFIVEALTRWWGEVGQKHYPNHSELLILCDAGGANGYRRRGWKWELQTQLVDPYHLTVTICHYPSGASKWNPIEHRVFSYISMNWAGEPLTSYEKALAFIRSTTTRQGLEIDAYLIDKVYPKGIKTSDEQLNSLNIHPHETLPQWNYTLKPR